MAQIGFSGLDELMLSMQEVAEIPESVQDEMLNAQADVVTEAQRAAVQSTFRQHTGELARSIKKGKPKRGKDGKRVLYVSPTGARVRGRGKKTRNAEILFVLNYGRKNSPATNVIGIANEKSAEATTKAGFDVYDKWLKSKNL